MGEIVRLQKYMAMCGAASRRGAEEIITAGRVTVNGKKITEQGVKVEIGADTVKLDGKVIKPSGRMFYIMLNKPVGYVTTVKDQFERPTVIDLVGTEINERIFPVGRLDYETEGLLLLTNDGDFTYKVTHPKHNIEKTYIAVLKGGITIKGLAQLRRGVKLDDGFVTSPAEVEMLDAENGHTTIKITIHEGKNRQVRRMFEAVGSKVKELQRVSIGTVELGNLPLGRWRHLTSHEINYLKNL
ncbi:MAG: rRNA pseudouridine synthase [Clostridia bacterium]|nr:rRNA pseudouridine synthase [Clostridia bacterium]